MKTDYKYLNRISFLCTMLVFIGTQAVFATPTTPTGDFIDNQDGTVTHKTPDSLGCVVRWGKNGRAQRDQGRQALTLTIKLLL